MQLNRLTGRGTLAEVPEGATAGDSGGGVAPEAAFDPDLTDLSDPTDGENGTLDPANAGRLSH